MNRKLSIITSAISVFLLTIALIPMTMAWFSSNKNVTATGMQMKAEASPNLIISNSKEDIIIPTYFEQVINFEENASKYAPCTHSEDPDYEETGLKYVTNPDQIDFISGLQRGDVNLEYGTAQNEVDGLKFYYENSVYIASNGKELSGAKLNACIASAVTDEDEIDSGSLMAISVDFYLKGDNEELTFCGTSNVASKDEIEIFDGEIPLNTNGYITIVMRFYFDGELLKESNNKAYINTATVDARKAMLNLKFTAVEE